MIRRVLCLIAGVDRETLSSCPATDKIWASHLGFSLCLSFVAVLGISFHATGYVIADPWVRFAASLVIALTVFMFDRALYQSDWFYQGFRWKVHNGTEEKTSRWRLGRIAIRLGISFGLAWVIAVFLELAIFSDTIGDKIKRDHLSANQAVFEKIDRYESQQNRDIEERRRNLAALETLYRQELAAPTPQEAPPPMRFEEFEQQIAGFDARERDLRRELRPIDEKIASYAQEMNAEELGQRLTASNTGRAGVGPKYQFAKRQKEVYDAQRAALETELSQLNVRRADVRATQGRMAAASSARFEQERAAVQNKRDTLQSQIEQARTELKALEAARSVNIENFRRQALSSSDFQKLKDDPLSRMTAYQELKNDPKDGATITLFSWMTKFLVIFLEVVPVVAKMFFSPPSVYAAKIQAEFERESEWARQEAYSLPLGPHPVDPLGLAGARHESRIGPLETTATDDRLEPIAKGPPRTSGRPEGERQFTEEQVAAALHERQIAPVPAAATHGGLEPIAKGPPPTSGRAEGEKQVTEEPLRSAGARHESQIGPLATTATDDRLEPIAKGPPPTSGRREGEKQFTEEPLDLAAALHERQIGPVPAGASQHRLKPIAKGPPFTSGRHEGEKQFTEEPLDLAAALHERQIAPVPAGASHGGLEQIKERPYVADGSDAEDPSTAQDEPRENERDEASGRQRSPQRVLATPPVTKDAETREVEQQLAEIESQLRREINRREIDRLRVANGPVLKAATRPAPERGRDTLNVAQPPTREQAPLAYALEDDIAGSHEHDQVGPHQPDQYGRRPRSG